MSKDKLVPKLRFKEFKNHLEWVKYTFGEIANYRKGPFGSALKKSIFVPKSQESVKIYEQQNAIDKNWKLERYFITKEYANKMKSFEVNPGDIIVSSAGTIGETYILPEDAEPGIINQALMRVGVNESKISKTLYIHLFENMIEDFSNKYSHGSAMKNIPPFSDLKSAETYFPSTEEQEKLVEFIKLFKIMINIQKRKLNKVKAVKSAYLSEMFPKEGEKYPKKRFQGFTEPWKKRTLNSIANSFDMLRIPVTAADRIPGDTPYYGANGIQDYIDGYTHDGEYILLAEDGANDLKNYPVHYVNGKVWVNNHAHVLQGNPEALDNRFLMYKLKTIDMEPYLVGGGRAKLNANVMMNIELSLPNLEEQIKIGSFFKNLDKQISIEEEKLVKLEKLKQAYLNDMFI